MTLKRNTDEQEKLLKEKSNTISNSLVQEIYSKDLRDKIIRIFDKTPLEQQPLAIVGIGISDNSFLRKIYQTIKEKTLRGEYFERFPLKFFRIYKNHKSVDESISSSSMFEIDYQTLFNDINRPDKVVKDIEAQGLKIEHNILYIQIFFNPVVSAISNQSTNNEFTISTITRLDRGSSKMDDIHNSLEALNNWSIYLENWSNYIHNSSLIILENHGISAQSISQGVDALNSSKLETSFELSNQNLISAEAFIILAASVGLFNNDPVKRYPKVSPCCQLSMHHLTLRDYVVRYVTENDLPRLYELEKLCWEHSRSTKQQIRRRLQNYPEGQFVLEKENKVLGVIYSQRISSIDSLEKCNAKNVHELLQLSGSIIQLLAVNVDPEVQNLNLGDQLLEFMLQRCSLITGVNQVVGVTLCKKFDLKGIHSFEEYIQLRGSEQDPVLSFHQAHGADIVKSIANYRPQDHANQKYGILVSYDIQNRVLNDKKIITETKVKITKTSTVIAPTNKNKMLSVIKENVVQLLGDNKQAFDLDRPVMEMGLDSADLLKLQLQIEEKFGQKLQAAFFFEYNTINKVIHYLTQAIEAPSEEDKIRPKYKAKETPPLERLKQKSVYDNQKISTTDIAIIGVSCKLPGGIETTEKLWEVLVNGDCVIGEFPHARTEWPTSADMPGIGYGGFMQHADAFDASFFRITPKEAQIIDPQQRILLELTWACLEDADILPDALKETNTGVFVGASNCDYSRLIQDANLETEAHNAIGSSLAVLANRLSYFFDFSGPSLLIDTACSSSLVALHTAVQSLNSGECETALVGGVNLICHPDLSIAYHKAGMLAEDGRCKVFDASANGYVRAEGAVMLMLKPLSKAIVERDNIHAVIKGSAINHGGLAGGLTVPNPQKQSELLITAWKKAGISAGDISYIEAHGTGTSLGDPIEIQGIQTAYSQFENNLENDKKVYHDKVCAIGSIKSNLGHLESAAGIVGLLKVIVSMRNKQLPASINFSQLNPKIILNNTSFCIPTEHQHWHGEKRRLAGVSSFGSGGANAHIVVEEYLEKTKSIVNQEKNGDYLFVLSASNQERLQNYVSKVISWLNQTVLGESFIHAIHSWQVGRVAMKQRLAIKIKNQVDLQNRLQAWLEGSNDLTHIWFGQIDQCDSSMGRQSQSDSAQQLLVNALSKKDLDQLGSMWVAGTEIDWQLLYTNNMQKKNMLKRISLPTYPFAKERYWIESDDKRKVVSSSHAIGSEIDVVTIGEKPLGEKLLGEKPIEHILAIPVWQSTAIEQNCTESTKAIQQQHIILYEMDQINVKQLESIVPDGYFYQLQSQAKKVVMGDRYIEYALSCFELIQKILRKKSEGKAFLQIVISHSSEQILLAGLSGLLKTASQENPRLVGQIIFVESEITLDKLVTHLEYNKSHIDDTIIKSVQGKRQILSWKVVQAYNNYELSQDRQLIAFKDRGVYLITGGLGGLGVLFTKEIIKNTSKSKIVLTGRSALSGKKQDVFNELSKLAIEQDGYPLEYRQLDIENLDQVKHLFITIKNKYSQINGVIHSAGMVSDNFILKKSKAEFRQVLAPKVTGTSNIDQASKDIKLDFLVLFSSFVSTLGNLGQADYAAANGFMDQFAAYRNRLAESKERHGHTISINWPLWKEGGMGVDQSSLEVMQQTMGMYPMQTYTGMQVFHHSLLSKYSQAMVINGKINKIMSALMQKKETTSPSAEGQLPTRNSSSFLHEETLKKVKQLFATVTKLPLSKIDGQEPLSSYGVDSIFINQLNLGLSKVFGEISKTLFFEYQTLAELTSYLTKEYELECFSWTEFKQQEGQQEIEKTQQLGVKNILSCYGDKIDEQSIISIDVKQQQKIAIIGMSGIYPQAENIGEFWKNLKTGKNCISEVPSDRWTLEGFYSSDVEQAIEQGKSYSKWGGFVDQFAQFDSLFFNISPREAMNIDPQERLFLQESWRALENSGYTRDALKRKFKQKVGVFAGITKAGFILNGTHLPSSGEGFFPHTSFSSVANRLSYFLDITGPSMPIDTMCSSSLTAIHEACEHINRGECELAFAGGVNLYLHPSSYTWLCSQQMLSRDGLCKSFGVGGNGYVPGEGTGVVLLKSLTSAIQDSDNIHGVILATHVNHGGKTNGYTVPNPKAQAELIRHTIDKAGITARDISYIEAHGTGTELGDPIEISGLQQAFAKDTQDIGYCKIGSAKSNIGHLEAAAGVAGLTKVLLQMKHRQVAPSLHTTHLNPNINFDKTAFCVNSTLSPWLTNSVNGQNMPRIAGISSFGAGGANAHIIVREYLEPENKKETVIQNSKVIIPLSARTPDQLRQKSLDLLNYLQEEDRTLDLNIVAYTLQAGRESMTERIGFLVNSIDQLNKKLQAHIAGEKNIEDFYQGETKSNRDTLSVFIDDVDFEETLDKWIVRKKLSKLLELWVKGLDFNWDKLYGKVKPARVALPSYPFAKERHWVNTAGTTQTTSVADSSAVLHPLVHRNTSDLRQQSYTSTFIGNEFFLNDHKVNEQKILPGVAYLEMVRAAVELASPTREKLSILELHNTVWVRPIVVSERKEVTIALHLNESDAGYGSDCNNEQIDFEIYSTDANDESCRGVESGALESTQEKIYCEGNVIFSHEPAPSQLSIEKLKEEMCHNEVDASDIYKAFTKLGIDYGSAHQAISAVYLGEKQLLAQLNLPSVIESSHNQYVLHPSLMDSALQASIGLIDDFIEQTGRPLLPFSLDFLRVISPCTKEMFSWVRCVTDYQSDNSLITFDVDLCDKLGNVCVQIRGFSSRIIEGKLGSSQKTTLQLRSQEEAKAELHTLLPVWNTAPQEILNKVGIPESTKILLLGDNQTQLDWVKKSYPNTRLLRLSSNSSIDTVQAQLKGYRFEHLLWMAPDVTKTDDKATNSNVQIIGQQEQGVLAVFRTVKALLNLDYADKEIQWTLITRKTQNVKINDRIVPTHAGIFGLIGSLAKEYLHWNLRLVDVDSLESLTANECMSLGWDKQGNALAYRQGEWFCQGLARVVRLPEPPPAYRQEGVYVVIGGAGGIGEVWSRFMIEQYQAKIVWIGRQKKNPNIENKINSLSQLGHAPVYFSADATRLNSLKHVFDSILELYPAIHGVVHSAIVLQDQSFALMEESTFRASLSAKVDISVNMDKVFGEHNLDFMLFFSSLISFTKAAGQSNYAAGCTFKDSFAQSLAKQKKYPVKIINWGYWGNVGIVTDEFYNKRMKENGIGSIESEEAMGSLQILISSEINQIALMRTVKTQVVENISLPEEVTCLPKETPSVLPNIQQPLSEMLPNKSLAVLKENLIYPEIYSLATEILVSNLVSIELFNPKAPLTLNRQVNPIYKRWLSASINYLQQQSALNHDLSFNQKVRKLKDLWEQWDRKKLTWIANSNIKAQINLMEICLKELPSILTGEKLATDIIFPNSSMQLVEGIYKDSVLVDYYNETLGNALSACIKLQLQADKDREIHILEIGAGTGGTTAKILPLLQEFSSAITEYCYTDLSKAFLIHAEEHYQPQFPPLTTAIFDVSKPVDSQSIEKGKYDFVIATNVLHATPNIRETLRNAKAVLKNQGTLLINEMSVWTFFNHVTFGLLEGWWLYEDTTLRLPGNPGLRPEKWQETLIEQGFESVYFPVKEAHNLGQQVIVASSNGQVRQQISKHLHPNLNNEIISDSGISDLETPPSPIKPTKHLVKSGESLRENSILYLQKIVSKTLKMQPSQLDPDHSFSDYGLDSILVVGLTNQLRKIFPDIKSTLFFEVHNINGLVDYLLENQKENLITVVEVSESLPATQKLASVPDDFITQKQKPLSIFRRSRRKSTQAVQKSAASSSILEVAVIGLTGRYPQSANLSEFWKNLSTATNCITEIPKNRWSWEEYYDSEKGKTGKIYTKWGGFLEDIDKFDPLFFKISPKEAKSMDPQERLFLESCYHAVEDAGYTPESLAKNDKIGVFVGVMNARYTTQPLHYSIANRVSYIFNFQGPSMAVDTACSSSLTAIHLALESMYSGLSECVIVGGVNLIIDPVHYLELAEMTMLSSGNQCKSFGDAADGFVDAEGVGALVLKSLGKAEQDGDHIYGVIKGSAINAGGKTNGYTVPNPKAQSNVVSKALERAQLDASYISYVEAHGTGTALGDPVEVAGLTRAFKESIKGKEKQFCAIGSLKSNIGHCESAAGIAGLTKVLLQLKHKKLVPSLHSDVTNPEIDFNKTPFKVQKKLEKWNPTIRKINGEIKEIPRIAGISSFGAGGANAHLIVQEYIAPIPSVAIDKNIQVIILLSARTIEQLKQKVRDLINFIINSKRDEQINTPYNLDLKALAYTLQVGRTPMAERLGFVVNSIDELVDKLESYCEFYCEPYCKGEQDIENFYQGQVKRNKDTLSAFNSDGDLQLTIEKWISDNKFINLLNLWVKGLQFDWNKLYGDAKPNRISLPTYPFAKERFWTERVDSVRQLSKSVINKELHPLLHNNISDISQQCFSSIFSGNEFFTMDHQLTIDDTVKQKVLPATIYLEMARAALEKSTSVEQESNHECRTMELYNIVWSEPIVINKNKQIFIALFSKENDQLDFEIYSKSEDNIQEIVHCQGQALLGSQLVPTKIDVEHLKSTMQLGRITSDNHYKSFSKLGINYGPGYRGVTSICLGENQLLGELNLPQSIEKNSNNHHNDFILHPTMVDSALQTTFKLISPINQPSLPLALESLRILRTCTRKMFVWARYSKTMNSKDTNTPLDIELYDQDGNICVQMLGVTYEKESSSVTPQIYEPIVSSKIPKQIPMVALESNNIMLNEPLSVTLSHNTLKKPIEITLATVNDLSTKKSTDTSFKPTDISLSIADELAAKNNNSISLSKSSPTLQNMTRKPSVQESIEYDN